jgi:hypothetical protein
MIAASQGYVSIHQYLGLALAILLIMHVAQTPSVAIAVFALLTGLVSSICRFHAGRRSCGSVTGLPGDRLRDLRAIRVDIPSPRNGCDYYVLIRGVPTRLFWWRSSAMALIPKKVVLDPPPTGPYTIPRTPITFSPALHIVSADNGLHEATTHLRWRLRSADERPTTLTWFSQNRDLVIWFEQWAGTYEGCPIQMIYHGEEDKDVQRTLEFLSPSLHLCKYLPTQNIEQLLAKYVPLSCDTYGRFDELDQCTQH